MFFSQNEIDFFIEEDLPYMDLTTKELGISEMEGEILFTFRQNGIVSCTEEAIRILERLGAVIKKSVPSGTEVEAGSTVLQAEGTAGTLHKAWKVCQNILEYAGGIATYTGLLVSQASGIPVFVTRKSQPGFKKIAMKAVISGKGHPHRLGLSETFLLFKNHQSFLEKDILLEKMEILKEKALLEKSIAVESDSEEEIRLFAEKGIRLFQLEKFPPKTLEKTVQSLKREYPDIRLLATGGIRLENIKAYCRTGIDGIVTTSPYYYSRPADIGVKIYKK
jgi:molybdenum transport protein